MNNQKSTRSEAGCRFLFFRPFVERGFQQKQRQKQAQKQQNKPKINKKQAKKQAQNQQKQQNKDKNKDSRKRMVRQEPTPCIRTFPAKSGTPLGGKNYLKGSL